jgi:hypothetical protein
MKLFELKIEDESDEVFSLSLVENPAIEADWVFFSKDGKREEVQFATVDGDKRLIVAPVLIPDKKILRIEEKSGEEYKVFFTAETIEKLAQKYLQNGYQDKATIEHSKNIDGKVSVVESWVSKSSTKDKSALYFNRAFPVGTWFVTIKVNDENLWKNYVKTGIIKAISIEGLFSHQLTKYAKEMGIFEKDIRELNEEEAKVVLSKIAEMLEAQPSVTSTYPGEAADDKKKYVAPALLEEEGNINVFGIETESFHMCPLAVELFLHLTSMEMDEDTKGMVRSAALIADRVFDIEEDVIEKGIATDKDIMQVEQLIEDFKDLIGEIDKIVGMKHDVSFMDGHLEIIKNYK